jgi:hypothetical protein
LSTTTRASTAHGWSTGTLVLGNRAWPARTGTGILVAEYGKSLGPPGNDWYPTTDHVVETVRHRFTLDGTTLDILLGDEVAYEQASAILRSLGELDPSSEHAARFWLAKVTSIERDRNRPGTFTVWMANRCIVVEWTDAGIVPVGWGGRVS